MTMENKEENLNYRFFSNIACPYYPCHSVPEGSKFNCLFCYCPLYALGSGCGGNYKYLENGVKDCSDCTLPHRPENYEYITGKYDEICEIAKRNRDNREDRK